MSRVEDGTMRGARDRLAKSEQFLGAARHALADGSWDAAVSNAVLSGIASCDGYLITRHGVKPSRDPREGVRLLRKHGGPSVAEHADKLERLISVKNMAQYGDRLSTSQEARDAVVRAERLFGWVQSTLRGDEP